jgi:peptidoglycan hydrolase-like protein with peptidoglycan-binding domain
MILQLLAGAAVLGGLYEYTKDDPKVQLVRGVTAAGGPVATVMPVVNAAVHAAQANPSLFVPLPKPPGYAPPLVPSLGPLQISPIVITPTGASNVVVSTNQDVQNALNTLAIANPPLVVDGNMGPLSKSALKVFQLTSGLSADGVAGPATKSALSQALSGLASPNAAIGRSAQVLSATLQSAAATVPIVSNQDIQHALNLLGATPPLVEDGNLGPIGIAAIKAFQMSHGLLVDGIAGPMVKTALQMALSAPAPSPTASDAYATDSIPGLGIFHGESYDLEARARNAWRVREDENYHPDRKTYWNPVENIDPDFINESELGVKFSESRQKMMRDDGSPVPFGVDNDFGYNYLPPPPPSPAVRPAAVVSPGAPSAPSPPPGTLLTTSRSNLSIAAPTGYAGVIYRPPSPGVSPPPPPGMVSPPPPPGMVTPPNPLPGFFPGRYPNQAYPGQSTYPYPVHRHHHRNDYLQQQNLGAGAAPLPPPPSPYAPTLQDYQQSWRDRSYQNDVSQQNAAVANAPDPSQASAVVSANPDVPDNQSVDPMLDQAIADSDNADAQSGAIDAASGASQSILDAGADFGYTSGRTGDFRHMTGTFGFGAVGGSKGGKSKHHHHHRSQQQSPQSQEGGGGGGGGGDDDDDYGAEFGVIAPPPPPMASSNAAFLAAAARNAAAGGNAGSISPMVYPPAPSGYTNPQGQPYPYQGPQGPGQSSGRHHHHHHHMSQQAQQAQQTQAYPSGYAGNGGYAPDTDPGDYDMSGDFGGPAKTSRHHESDNLARARTTVRS